MITKTGEIQKQAFFNPLHLLAAGVVHVTQNLLMHALLKNDVYPLIEHIRKYFGAEMGDQLLKRFTNGDIGGFWEGVAALVPETKILFNEISHMGAKTKSGLANKGIDLATMKPRDVACIRRAIKGDFGWITSNPHMIETVADVLERKSPEAAFMLRFAATSGELSPTVAKQLAASIGDAIKTTPAIKELSAGMAKAMSADNLRNLLTNKEYQEALKKSTFAEKVTEILGNGALFAADPLAAGFNAVKRISASDTTERLANAAANSNAVVEAVASVPKKMKDAAVNIFVTKPLNNAFERGLEGESYSKFWDHPVRRVVQRYGLNYMTQGMAEFSNRLGRAAHDVGLTKERIDMIQRRAIDLRNRARNAGIDISEYGGDRGLFLEAIKGGELEQKILNYEAAKYLKNIELNRESEAIGNAFKSKMDAKFEKSIAHLSPEEQAIRRQNRADRLATRRQAQLDEDAAERKARKQRALEIADLLKEPAINRGKNIVSSAKSKAWNKVEDMAGVDWKEQARLKAEAIAKAEKEQKYTLHTDDLAAGEQAAVDMRARLLAKRERRRAAQCTNQSIGGTASTPNTVNFSLSMTRHTG